MAQKIILIKASEATRALLDLADSEVDMKVLRIPDAEITNAEAELDGIEDKYWISSDDESIKAGDINEGILLPREAINS